MSSIAHMINVPIERYLYDWFLRLFNVFSILALFNAFNKPFLEILMDFLGCVEGGGYRPIECILLF